MNKSEMNRPWWQSELQLCEGCTVVHTVIAISNKIELSWLNQSFDTIKLNAKIGSFIEI